MGAKHNKIKERNTQKGVASTVTNVVYSENLMKSRYFVVSSVLSSLLFSCCLLMLMCCRSERSHDSTKPPALEQLLPGSGDFSRATTKPHHNIYSKSIPLLSYYYRSLI
jgi:hypothetical protein